MIVAPEALAVDAGAAVLAAGGNAIDAAATCAFVQGVVDPHDTSVGGFALLNLQLWDDAPMAARQLDAPALAGSLTSPEMPARRSALRRDLRRRRARPMCRWWIGMAPASR
jgi:gamma-glutamyltranspeptidase/glutathione hydrolase